MKKAADALPNWRLKREREQRCWSQLEVADVVGTTALNVSRWERGITIPNVYFRRELCRVFERSAHALGFLDAEPATNGEQQPSSSIEVFYADISSFEGGREQEPQAGVMESLENAPGLKNVIETISSENEQPGKAESISPTWNGLFQRNASWMEHEKVLTSIPQSREMETMPSDEGMRCPRVLSIREKFFGHDYADIVQILNNLAMLYHVQGKYEEAEKLYGRALAILETILGIEHSLIMVTYDDMTELCQE